MVSWLFCFLFYVIREFHRFLHQGVAENLERTVFAYVNLIHKWRLIHYFVFMQIILASLVCTSKIQNNFCFKVRIVMMISIKTEE